MYVRRARDARRARGPTATSGGSPGCSGDCKDDDRGQLCPLPLTPGRGSVTDWLDALSVDNPLVYGRSPLWQASRHVGLTSDLDHCRERRASRQRFLSPAGHRCIDQPPPFWAPWDEQQRRVLEHGALSCAQHRLLGFVRPSHHDTPWPWEPEAGGVHGGLDTCRAANAGEGCGDWRTVPGTPSNKIPAAQRPSAATTAAPLREKSLCGRRATANRSRPPARTARRRRPPPEEERPPDGIPQPRDPHPVHAQRHDDSRPLEEARLANGAPPQAIDRP